MSAPVPVAAAGNGLPPSLLSATGISIAFRLRRARLQAVRRVDVSLGARETVALVGESGSGKSTVARMLVRAYEPDEGTIVFDGQDITHLRDRQLLPVRKRLQLISQDPYASLNPHMTVGEIVAEPILIHARPNRAELAEAVVEALEWVGLTRSTLFLTPQQFSGGQRQRIAIARALVLRPAVLIADEPVSALDVSIQAQVIRLFHRIQEALGLAYLLISHDLALVREVSDRVLVMYLGSLVESGPTEAVISSPLHPYTVALIDAAPRLGRRTGRVILKGEPPSPLQVPSGCPFHSRCPIARPRCGEEAPALVAAGAGRAAACFYPGELAVGDTAARSGT